MKKFHFSTLALQEAIPYSKRSHIFSALMQDPAVWISLQDPSFLNQVIQSLKEYPEDWSPAAVALASLELKTDLDIYTKQPLIPLNKDIRLQVAKTYESLTKGEPLFEETSLDLPPDPVWVSRTVLPKAGLLALALRERYRLLGSWDGLRSDLEGIVDFDLSVWKTPIACLMGLIPNPIDFLVELVSGSITNELSTPESVSFDLQSAAIHGLLSLPISHNEQIIAATKLFDSISPGNHRSLLDILTLKKPVLANAIAQLLTEKFQFSAKDCLEDAGMDQLGTLVNLTYLAELHRSAGQYGQSLRLFDQTIKITQHLLADYAARWATTASKAITDLDSESSIHYSDIFSSWEYAHQCLNIEQDEKNASPYQLAISETRIQARDQDEIHRWLILLEQPVESANPIPLTILIALARHFLATDEYNLSRRIAIEITQSLLTNNPAYYGNGKLERLYGTNSRTRLELLLSLHDLLMNLELYEEAIAVLSEALKERPNSSEIMICLGYAHQKEGCISESIQVLEIATILDPDSLPARRYLAKSLELDHAFEKALELRDLIYAAVKNAPDANQDRDSDALDLANCALLAGNGERASEICREVLERDIPNWKAHTLYGKALFLQHEDAAAISSFQNATQLAPEQPEPWLELAFILQRMDHDEQANTILQTAAQAAPKSAQIHLELGKSLLANNALTSAVSSLRQAYDIANSEEPIQSNKIVSPILLQAAERLGETLRRLGHLVDSKEVLESTLSRIETLTPTEQSEYRYNYAKTLLSLGETEAALPILKKVIDNGPQSLQPYLDYGKALLESGSDPEDAIHALVHIHNEQPDHAEALALLAEAYEAGLYYAKATEKYLEVMESDFYNQKHWQERICFGLGRSALAQGHMEQAVAAFQDAIQANPQNPAIYRSLAQAYWSSNLPTDGWSAAKTALQLDPANKDNLAWFADHVINLFDTGNQQTFPSTLGMAITGGVSTAQNVVYLHPDQLVIDAIEAFDIHEPYISFPACLLVRLGRLQAVAGNPAQAIKILQSAIKSENPTPRDLKTAGEYLYQLDDYSDAVLAFEHAMSLLGPSNNQLLTEIQLDLAQTYLAINQVEGAKNCIETALKVAPEESALYLTLAIIELQTNNTSNALEVLHQGIERCRLPDGKIMMHYWCAILERHLKKYAVALDHIDSALRIKKKYSSQPKSEVGEISLIHTAVELSRLMLDRQSARRYLDDLPALKTPDQMPDTANYLLNCLCSSAEIALEDSDNDRANEDVQSVLRIRAELTNHFPRFYALQARLAYRNNDAETAQQALKECLSHINAIDRSPETHNNKSVSKLFPIKSETIKQILPEDRSFDLIGAVNAALELHEWDIAFELAQQALDKDEDHLALNMIFARILVTSIEFSNLCSELETIQHKPIIPVIEKEEASTLTRIIESAEKAYWLAAQGSPRFNQNTLQIHQHPEINRWRNRGSAALYSINESQNMSSLELWQDDLVDPDDTAAYIAAARHLPSNEAGLHAIYVKTSENPHPNVQVQLALAEINIDPEKALRKARELAYLNTANITKEDRVIRYALLAHIAFRINEQATALEALRSALEIWPDEPRWHALAGWALLHYNQGESPAQAIKDAIYHFEQAIHIEPNNADHYIQLAEATAMIDGSNSISVQHAIHLLEKATQHLPNHAGIWIALAKYHYQLQSNSDLAQAARCIDKAIQLEKDDRNTAKNIEPSLLKAEIALLRGNANDAYLEASTIRNEFPESPEAVMVQVRALEKMGRVEDALSELNRIGEPLKNAKELQLKRAFLMGKCCDHEAELGELRALAIKYPNEFDIIRALVEKLADYGSTDEAIQTAQMALQNPNYSVDASQLAGLHYLLGNSLSLLGQLDQAIHQLTQAINYQPRQIEAYLVLGNVYQKQRQHKKAQKAFHKAIQIAPDDARPYVQAALSYKEGKDYQNAETLLRKAVDLSPQDVNIRKQLAAIIAINLVQNPHPFQAHSTH
jgi:tetratricopeptide (TPR) repeat protein